MRSIEKEYYDKLFKENRDKTWDDAPGKKVIMSANICDIGCGNGYFINEVRKCNPIKEHMQSYYGIDISCEAINKAKSKYAGINFRYMDATSLDFKDNTMDVVFSYGVIEHIQQPVLALKQIQRVVKIDGLFLMMIPSLGCYRRDRTDEGWYEDLDENKQLQWNYLRETWEKIFKQVNLSLFNTNESKKYGALKP